jgi:hypothetical protein
MHLPHAKHGDAHPDPGQHHPFRETDDPGIVALASGGGFRGGNADLQRLAVTTATLRGTRCALAGCGKPREDPIHFAADD